jgi:hypothetical protein
VQDLPRKRLLIHPPSVDSISPMRCDQRSAAIDTDGELLSTKAVAVIERAWALPMWGPMAHPCQIARHDRLSAQFLRLGKRVPDCSDRGGAALVGLDCLAGIHRRDAPAEGVCRVGWHSGTSNENGWRTPRIRVVARRGGQASFVRWMARRVWIGSRPTANRKGRDKAFRTRRPLPWS